MDSIQKLIFSFLNKRKKNPKALIKIKETIFNILYKGNHVFKVINEKEKYVPYIHLPSGEVVQFDSSYQEIQSLFNVTFGVDFFQNKFSKELFNYIKDKILLSDRIIILNKFTCIYDTRLYISCGDKHMVTIDEHDNLIKVKNGYNNIYFDGDYTLPEWDPSNCNSVYSCTESFNINVLVPDGPYIYTGDIQKYVLRTWIIGTLLKIKPLPILLFYGNKSSGKTLTSKAIIKLFMGDRSNVSIFPDNKRSLMACITENFVYAIDNLDSKPPSWFPDTMTLAATGGELGERILFSDSKTHKKQIVSSMIITTRNANFAKREDIKDRVLPIFFEDRADYSIPEESLIKFIIDNRGNILSELAHEAQSFLNNTDNIKFTEKYRFTRFGELLQHLIPTRSTLDISTIIKAIVNSQLQSLTDLDPLIQAIVEFDFSKIEHNYIEGTPTEIIKLLESNTAYSNKLKPRVFARKLKENIDVLEMNGWAISFSKFGHTTKFKLVPNLTKSQVSSSFI